MLTFILAAATIPTMTSIAQLRMDSVNHAWRTCVEQRAKSYRDVIPSSSSISAQSATDAAMQSCAEFERDMRTALYSYIPEMLRGEGVKSFGASGVNMLAEETLISVVKDIRETVESKLGAQ